MLGTEFMPPLFEGTFLYMPVTAPGISVAEAERLLTASDTVIRGFPEVASVYGKAGRDVGMLVRNLRAELGVTFTSEFIPIEGLKVVGKFPKEYEYVNAYGAAVVLGPAIEAARSLLAFLTGPASKARFRDFGLE